MTIWELRRLAQGQKWHSISRNMTRTSVRGMCQCRVWGTCPWEWYTFILPWHVCWCDQQCRALRWQRWCGDNRSSKITVPLRAKLKKNSFPISCQMAIFTVTAHGMYVEAFMFIMHLQTPCSSLLGNYIHCPCFKERNNRQQMQITCPQGIGSHNSLSEPASCIVTRPVPPHQVAMTSNVTAQARVASPFPLGRPMLTPPVPTKPMLTPLRQADLRQSWQAPSSTCSPPTLIEVVWAQRVHPPNSQPSPGAPNCQTPGPTVGRLRRKAMSLLGCPSPGKCVAPLSGYKKCAWRGKWKPVGTSVTKLGPVLFWCFKFALPAQMQYCSPSEAHC